MLNIISKCFILVHFYFTQPLKGYLWTENPTNKNNYL